MENKKAINNEKLQVDAAKEDSNKNYIIYIREHLGWGERYMDGPYTENETKECVKQYTEYEGVTEYEVLTEAEARIELLLNVYIGKGRYIDLRKYSPETESMRYTNNLVIINDKKNKEYYIYDENIEMCWWLTEAFLLTFEEAQEKGLAMHTGGFNE